MAQKAAAHGAHKILGNSDEDDHEDVGKTEETEDEWAKCLHTHCQTSVPHQSTPDNSSVESSNRVIYGAPA
jgi:hypothetical protein